MYPKETPKSMGHMPKNNPRVVIPKANPGLFFITLSNMPKHMGMVMEKRKTPIMDTNIRSFPMSKKGIQEREEKIPTLFEPKRSLKYPPIALPSPMVKKRKKACHMVLFQDIGMAYPT